MPKGYAVENGGSGYNDSKIMASVATSVKALAWILGIALAAYLAFCIAAFCVYTLTEIPDSCCTAAKTTHSIIFRETDTFGDCSLAEDCTVTQAMQTFNGSLVLASDGSTSIGTSLGTCVSVGPIVDISEDDGYVQLCSVEYTFNGEGSVGAGKITVMGSYVVPSNTSDPAAFVLTQWSTIGGTGTYWPPNGGQLSFTTNPDLAYRVITMTYATIN